VTADRYLDLRARALTRDLFLDEEARNVDLREGPTASSSPCVISCASDGGASCGRAVTDHR